MIAHVVRGVGAALVASALAWPMLAGAAWAQEAAGTALTLLLPSEGAVGQQMTVGAHLTTAAGVTLPGVTVVFRQQIAFMNAEGEVALGSAVTDNDGVATLRFVPRIEGNMGIVADFAGDGPLGPAAASGAVSVRPGGPLYTEEAGIRVPGINVSLLAGVLGTIWGAYLVVMVLLWLIAREGTEMAQTSTGATRE